MKRKTVFTCIIILLFSLLMPNVLKCAGAVPLPPCIFYGYVFVNGVPAQDGLNVTAVISGVGHWTTQTMNGTYGWPLKGSSYLQIPSDDPDTSAIDGGVDGARVQFYVQENIAAQTGTFESGGAKNLTLTAFSTTYVVIDQASVTNQEASVQSVQTVGFHARWGQNSSDVIFGAITIGKRELLTNTTGWASYQFTSSTVGKQEWNVTSVNCNGVTTYVQTTPNPSIIWDRIKIVDGGLTEDSVAPGQTVTAWFKAVYEYGNSTFDNTNGSSLYVNGSAASWSTTNNRWEYSFNATTAGTENFVVTGALDSLYSLTAINDNTGAKILTVLDQPLLTGALLYGVLAAIIIAACSAAILWMRRKGYKLRVFKEPEKQPHKSR